MSTQASHYHFYGENLKELPIQMISNSLGQKLEEFCPTQKNMVTMYVCGPTVYDDLHIGNFRGVVVFHVVSQWLRKCGYEVKYIYNYTDVDDKIIQKAQELKCHSQDISEKYIQSFQRDFQALNLAPHTHNPRVTETMEEIIDFIQGLLDKNCAYCVDGQVFFSIDHFPSYGQLSGQNLQEMRAGERVKVDPSKKNPLDFVLWKPSKKNEPSWDSPWGKGRPGWHIECSAMIQKFIGEHLDIHGGGMDLMFPHHENEIAQGEALRAKTDHLQDTKDSKCHHQSKIPYAKYWMHNHFIQVNSEKMSKSLGNFWKAKDFFEQFTPWVYKYFILSTHYRHPINLTEEKIIHSIQSMERILTPLAWMELFEKELQKDASLQVLRHQKNQSQPNLEKKIAEFIKVLNTEEQLIRQSLADDFNTAKALSSFFSVFRAFNTLNFQLLSIHSDLQDIRKHWQAFIASWRDIIPLFPQNPGECLNSLQWVKYRLSHNQARLLQNVPCESGTNETNSILGEESYSHLINEIREKSEKRRLARTEKNFKLADTIRQEFLTRNIELNESLATWQTLEPQPWQLWKVILKIPEKDE